VPWCGGSWTAAFEPRSLSRPDRDPGLLRIANATVAAHLRRSDFRVRAERNRIDAQCLGRRISVEFHCSGILEFEPARRGGYDLVTAHNFMDLVPMARALSLFSEWLAEGGLFYATLNYDGDTALFPLYRDESFETALLAEYDASMERRLARGEPTGGARAGRRLHALLRPAGFDVVAYGSSDWNITPHEARYRNRDHDVLCALLDMIHGEGERQPGIDRNRLERWHTERRSQLETGQLGMIVHQLDMVARRRQDFTALT
jgi:hypothetical protein